MTEHDEKAESEIDEQTGEDYVKWRKTFDISEQTETITKILQDDEALRTMHTKLVPQHVSYATFWSNYFWQLHLQETLTKKRLEIIRRMQKTKGTSDEHVPEKDKETAEESSSSPKASKAEGDEKTPTPEDQANAPAPAKSGASALADDDDDEEMGWGSDEDDA